MDVTTVILAIAALLAAAGRITVQLLPLLSDRALRRAVRLARASQQKR